MTKGDVVIINGERYVFESISTAGDGSVWQVAPFYPSAPSVWQAGGYLGDCTMSEPTLAELVTKVAKLDLALEQSEEIVDETIAQYVSAKSEIDALIYKMIQAAKENLK